MIYVVDSHALIWLLEGNDRLSTRAKSILVDPISRIVIPTMVLAEIGYLYAHKRVKTNVKNVLTGLASADNCTIYPLDERVVEYIPAILELHDGIIVATAIVYRDVLGEEVVVITNDKSIIESGLVPTVW